MPDHLHLFCAPVVREITLETWVRYWKRLFTLTANEKDWQWQSRHWDRRMRSQLNYRETSAYMHANPARKGLHAVHWPYTGSLEQPPLVTAGKASGEGKRPASRIWVHQPA